MLTRRDFALMAASTGSVLVGAEGSTNNEAQAAAPGPGDDANAKGVSRALARYLVTARYEDLPKSVQHEGTRTLLNWIGVATGSSAHPAVNCAAETMKRFAGPAQASLLGRKERFDVLNAALVNGISGHVLDFDDTHLKTIVHPSTVIVPALLAAVELVPTNGKDFLNALVLGVETACRIGNSVYPEHYDAGWHITGTAGVFGAAAAVGKVLRLNEQQMTWAISLAASQPVGFRESFGSWNKPFNPGRSASNGALAAFLASQNFEASDEMIEAKRGWANAISARHNYNEITGELGQRYEAALNTYKPFPCGIVLHPIITGALEIGRAANISPDDIKEVQLGVHPLVLELTGKKEPSTGLEGKFSVYHTVAVALIEKNCGVRQFTDEAVKNPRVVALRQRVVPTIDKAVKEDQAEIAVILRNGKKFQRFVEHAIGSLEVPMTDKQLEGKFLDLATGVLPSAQANQVMDLCWRVADLGNAAEIAVRAQALA